ncbi:MAG: LytTR family transcriptional regulator DNA-binding domain-containing protein [Bacteroidia bacterium]
MRLQLPPYYKLSWMATGLLVSVLAATVLGTPHTIDEPILYQKIIFNLLIGGTIWGLYLIVVLQFDQKMPWEKIEKSKRWFWQILFTLPAAIWIDWAGVKLRNFVLDAEYIPHIFWYTDFPVMIFLTLIIQYLFQQAYLKHLVVAEVRVASPQIEAPATNEIPAHISLKKGKKTYQIQCKEIAYLYRTEQINFLRLKDGKDWIWDQSLSVLESQLDPQQFFRVNRRLLLSKQAIISFEVLANRQTQIQLNPPLESPALLNKNRLAQFKQWYQDQ